jgi:hypothetical protein
MMVSSILSPVFAELKAEPLPMTHEPEEGRALKRVPLKCYA